jgi:hypothetical protein
MLEDDRKRRIMAEQEFRHMVAVRTGKVAAEDSYEEWLRDCTERKFASRAEEMFKSYGQELRGSEVFVQIMAGVLPFEIKNTVTGQTEFEKVEYY